ncbi:MAG: nitroreductase [Deltaproteobacteria bacterium]|nr:nitroreductase [Deltaproteobacteria bacterium]
MDIIEAIYQRKSIRGFKSDPVSRDILTKILDAACRSPSAVNTQPWEFIVLTGDVLDRVRVAIIDKLNKKEPMHPEHHIVNWPNDSIYRERQVDLAKKLFQLMDIRREDREKRAVWLERGFRFFDAPIGILILTDKSLGDVGPLLDLGAAMQTLCLAALNFGLGTCIEDQGVLYPEVLRKIAQIPENKKIIIAIAMGYPDWDFPANALVNSRESLDNNTRWMGF